MPTPLYSLLALLLVLLLSGGGHLTAHAALPPGDRAVAHVLLTPWLTEAGVQPELFEDPSGKMSLQAVQAAPFYRSPVAVPNIGFSQSVWWLRFSARNMGSQPRQWFLELGHPNLDEVTFYRPGAGGLVPFETGRNAPFAQREIRHRHFVFDLHLPPGEAQQYYLRIRSTTAYSLPLTLYTPMAFTLQERNLQLGLGFYYGLVFVMLVFNFLLWLATRDRNHLWYSLTLLTLHGLFQLANNGLAYEWLWPRAVWWNGHCLGFFLGVSTFCVLQFGQFFLETRQHLPRWHRLLDACKYTGLLLAAFNLTPDWSWTSQMSVQLNSKLGVFAACVLWVVALLSWRKGQRDARFFVLAWSALLVGALITGFTTFGWLPSGFWTTHALQAGTAVEVVLLSLGLADRFRRVQHEMLAAQQAQLAQEQKAKQAQERLVERLQKLDRLKDEFIANVSHELRTPLNGIIGLSDSMLDGATGEISPAQRYNLELVVASGRRLFHLVSDLIDFSQLKHREIRLHTRPVWLREVVEVVLKLSAPLVNAQQVSLYNDVAADLPPILADEDRLQQILHNLIGNAIKFTSAGEVRVSAQLTRQFVEITVSDTGPGIDPADHSRIFASFEQADGSLTRAHSGSGLGLAITRQLVELHGGQIRVDSRLGQGAQFHFLMPLASAAGEQPAPVLSLIPQRDSRLPQAPQVLEAVPLSPLEDAYTFQVLVVDDEPINVQVLVNMLSLQRYAVTRAHSGAEALELMQKQSFDLVLLDVMMPHMSGYEVCEAIREHYPSSALPVVFLTARNQVADLVQGFETGANDYLTKPVAKNELLARIRTHIQLSKINLSYARFVPDEFLRHLGRESILDVRLGDQIQREMTILFSDIRSFTALSEQMTPKQNFDFINDYLSRISPLIRMHEGYIDKYLGDGIMALFPHTAQDALDAAMEMLQELALLNQERLEQGYVPIQVGVGLHTGLLMLGTIGEAERMEGTVISDAVNTASRLEGLTKLYGSTLIISESVLARLDDPEAHPLRYLGQVRVKGKSESIGIYEVLEAWLSPDYALRYRSLADFEAAVQAYFARDIETAASGFEAVLAANPDDRAASYYLQRCERFLQQGTPEDVSPAFV